jgi:fumarate hydratase subunit alpha
MREINSEVIINAVEKLCLEAACYLPSDVKQALNNGYQQESCALAKDFFAQYLENSAISEKEHLPICQDTGFAVFFVERGEDTKVVGANLRDAITIGAEAGYKNYYLRKSIVTDPLFKRKNTFTNTPVIIHERTVPGNQIKITLAPKGGGSENMSALKMLKPSDGRQGVVDFVVDTIVNAGGNPCPPTVVGVGIGGTMEYAAFLAKKALLRPIGSVHSDPEYAELEAEILEKINASGVGAQGLGGDITSLAVHIEWHPCHLASLPVAVNPNCHAARHADVIL